MEIDPKALPSQEGTTPITRDINLKESESREAEDETSKNEAPDLSAELESLKIKNLELQRQKEHWREKYERDITNKPSVETDDEFLSDEGKLLKEKLNKLEQQFISRQKQDEEARIFMLYPQLKDKSDEFREFIDDPENSGIKLEKAAKLFLLENGLLDVPPKRIGLERGTSGSKTPSSGLSKDDIKRLRETQPRRYQQMLRDGRIDPDKIV